MLATKKQLIEAKKVFRKAERKGLADVHTYTNMVNALVRCDDVEGARTLMTAMVEAGLTPNIVTYTSYLKGLCTRGDIERAFATVAEMEAARPAIHPNLRTANTLLRGCLRAGALDAAETLVEKMQMSWGLSPDASSYETVNACLCQGLRLERSEQLLDQLIAAGEACRSGDAVLAGEADASKNPALYIQYARAAALLGEWETCNKGLALADAALDIDSFLKRQAQVVQAPRASSRDLAASAGVEGAAAANRDRLRSVKQFARHRLEELRIEAALVRSYLLKNTRSAAELTDLSKSFGALGSLESLAGAFRRILYFGTAKLATSDPPAVRTSLLDALKFKFGMQSWCERLAVRRSVAPKHITAEFEASFEPVVGPTGKIEFAGVFGAKREALPLKIEVGSGRGEWAAAQAIQDTGSNWATLELRHDRVYQAFARMVFQGVKNICTIGGDAVEVVGQRLSPKSVDSFYINHPEPPERSSGQGDSQGQHLLTDQFFESMSRALVSDGIITLVTDNLAYGRSLAESVMENGWYSTTRTLKPVIGGYRIVYDPPVKALFESESGKGGVKLFEGTPGPECGHLSTDSSSYFDRMWKEGDKHKRYYFCVTRPN